MATTTYPTGSSYEKVQHDIAATNGNFFHYRSLLTCSVVVEMDNGLVVSVSHTSDGINVFTYDKTLQHLVDLLWTDTKGARKQLNKLTKLSADNVAWESNSQKEQPMVEPEEVQTEVEAEAVTATTDLHLQQELVATTQEPQNIGYIRVSTVGQNTARQLVGVKLDVVFEEKISGKTMNRPELIAAVKHCRPGDILHVHSLDRVCRSGAGDAVALVKELGAKGVGIKFHKEGMEFYGVMSAAQQGVLSILASVAEMERGMIKERQAEGIAAAKAAGKPNGRPKSAVTVNDVNRLKAEGLPMNKIATKLGIGRTTLYRLVEQSKVVK